MDDLKRTVDGQLYWHYSLLKKWDVNETARILFNPDWLRLLNSIKKEGILDQFEIDDSGITYDGNHRLEGVTHWINKGVKVADNGCSLEWIPVHLNAPQSDEEKLEIAMKGNGQSFAVWNKDWVADNQELLSSIPSLEDYIIDTEEPVTFYDFLEYYEDEDDSSDEKDENEDTDSQSEGSDDDEEEEAEKLSGKPRKKTLKEITCPNCEHHFTI